MRTVGQILSEARKRKGVSLEEVESSIKIRKPILQALEDGNWGKLPSATFVKGFIRNYGQYLGLDPSQLLAFFRREYDEKKNQDNKFLGIKKNRFAITPTLVAVLFVVFSLGAAVTYLYGQYRTFVAAPFLEVDDPSDNLKIATPEVNVIGKTYSDVVLKINGQKVEQTLGGTFSVSVSLASGVNQIVVTAQNNFGKISKVTRTVVVEVPTPLAETPKPPTATASAAPQSLNNDNELILTIGPDSSWVKVETDGSSSYEGILLANSTKSFKAKSIFKVTAGNGGSTKVTLNGKDQGLLGGPNQVVTKEFKVGS